MTTPDKDDHAHHEQAVPRRGGSAPAAILPDDCLPGLDGEAFKYEIGVPAPADAAALQRLRRSTEARICLGRSGPRMRTSNLLRFLADHSRSCDAVHREVAGDWLRRAAMVCVQSRVRDKTEYLTRPDLGRRLSDASRTTILNTCRPSPQVQLVFSEGLSADALTANFDEIFPFLQRGLKAAGLVVGETIYVRYGRVKIGDEIGELLNARAVAVLVGERPGLGQSESMSAYLVRQPTVRGTVESDRICISNIHRGGTPPVEAAAAIIETLHQLATGAS